MPLRDIPLVFLESRYKDAQKLAQKWGFEAREPHGRDCFALELLDERLQLKKLDELKLGAIYVDFAAGKSAYRRKSGGGRTQAIARAAGLRKGAHPSVVDATAGLGADAFVLASLGCRVHMIERSPVVAALLEDGLARAKQDKEIGPLVARNLSLIFQDSLEALTSLPFKPDVVYLDPMYPEKKKPALVKKEMRVFKSLVGDDSDAGELFKTALDTAQVRVVVKRPAYAKYLASRIPAESIKTKKNRFDLYFC